MKRRAECESEAHFYILNLNFRTLVNVGIKKQSARFTKCDKISHEVESQIAQSNAFSALNINTISSKVCVANTGKSVNASDLNIHLLIFCILRNSINAYTAGSAAKVSAFPHCGS